MKQKPVVIDLFCGAGGESTGIHQALGNDIKLFAVNHWQRACATHAANFPDDECICQDIQTVIPTSLVKDREVELLWASPECTHFSVARGDKPMDDQSRCTPFDVLRWVTSLNVKRVIVENVKEFVTWGPLGKDNRPIPSRKGEFFNMFVNAIRAMGYTVEWRLLNAADFGAPTTRTRLFLQAVRGGKKIVWPTQTHAKNSPTSPWIPAKDIIDWSIPCPSIDEREKPLADATMRRILNGIEKFWGEGARPFLCRYNGGDNRNHSIDEPMPVLDTSNRYGLVQPIIAELRGKSGCRSIDDPLSTVSCSGGHHALIMEYYGNGMCHNPKESPLPVVTTKERFALVNADPKNVRLGFRMLQPHELAAAQSFPKDYIFTGTKGDVVKQIGNAVVPTVAEALVKAC